LLERPAVKDEEMAQSLRWMLDARLDYPAAEANLAWLDVPAHEAQGNRPRQLYAVAAQKSVMDERTRLVEETGRLLSTIDVRETARRNLAALVEERSGSGVMLLVAEANGLQITVTFQGELYLERFIPEKVLEERSVGDTEARERQAERLALEIQRTLDFLRRNFPQVTLGEILVGPLPPEIGLASGLASRLSEPVRSLDLCEYFDWPTDSDFGKLEVQARYLTAIGAALRYRDARPA
jgi:Tfp pilus assembly PilM family ATPase